jgi:drug/metabolite transporter (DMT)-like permease
MIQSPLITPRSWLMIAILGLVWGSTFMFIEIALRGITPFWLAAGRISFAAALTCMIWGLRGARLFHANPTKRDWVRLMIVGALSSAVPFMLISWGQQFTTAGFTGVSMASAALLILPLAHFTVPGERMTPRRVAGFVVGFFGVVVLVGPSALTSSGIEGETLGRLACISAAGCYAVSSINIRQLPDIDPLGLSAMTLVFGTIVVISMALIVEGAPPQPDTDTLAVLALLGLVPTAGANFIRTVVARTAGPVFLSIVNYIVPVVSVITGILFLGEPVFATLFIALGLILAGVGLSQYGAFRRLFSNSTHSD